MFLRVQSTLPDDLENLIRETISCCIQVHRELGSGLLEGVYPRALAIELETRNIPFERERPAPVRYKGRIIYQQRIDLLVDGRLIVEIKSVERLHPSHVSQVISYMRTTGARAGLLINFKVPILKQGIRRLVL
jgi:GxxExxY protein